MFSKSVMRSSFYRSMRFFSTTPHQPRTAVVLSGCGVYDGAEITEAVAMIVALSKKGAHVDYFAPDMNQYHVINHNTGDEIDQTRNVLIESARITRGDVQDLKELNVKEYEAIFFPGGFGAAKNLSTFALEGSEMKVLEDVILILRKARAYNVNIGMCCISPIIAANVR